MPVVHLVRSAPDDCKQVTLTARGEVFEAGSVDLGLSMISGSGGRLIVSFTEAIRSKSSRLPSADWFDSRLSSYGPLRFSSPAAGVHDCSRFSFRREVVSFGSQNDLKWIHDCTY